eukprot:757022-Hanusia_phi.AAC.2
MEAPCIPAVHPDRIHADVADITSNSSDVIDQKNALASISTLEKELCPDQPDCDKWGPEVFMENKGVESILDDDCVRKIDASMDMSKLLAEISTELTDQDPFYVVDLTTVLSKLDQWKVLLPRVKPFYAIKCNNDTYITRMLALAGCGFDCASKAEIKAALELGVEPARIIYANPCKQASMVAFAQRSGVKKMTADNIEELYKISEIFPDAEVVIRIAVDDSKSVCRFNSKFGAPKHEWDALLQTSKTLGINVVGFSFHVGSGCGDLKPFADAVASAREAFDLATSYGFEPVLLDCGGGFPGTDDGEFSFKDVALTLSDALDHFFPPSSGVDIIAEPGRYMVCASHTYAVAVIAKRQLTEAQLADTAEIESFGARPSKESEGQDIQIFKQSEAVSEDNTPEVALYINDGCYGSFNCVVFDHAVVVPHVLFDPVDTSRSIPTKLFGPTCDSIDVVLPCTRLPEMNVGDWIWFPDMGAYTRCASSKFNGQGNHDIVYVWRGMP